jgi:hypothetical protein
MRANRNSVTQLNAGNPGAESVKRGPVNAPSLFLGAEDHQPIEINLKMHAVSKTTVVEWHQKYLSGQQGTSDKAWPGQAWVITTPENISKVEEAAYGLDLSLCDFHVFGPLKKAWMKMSRLQWFQQQPSEFFGGDPSAGATAGCLSRSPMWTIFNCLYSCA